MTKAPYTNSITPKKQPDNNTNATKNFDYTKIADRLRTVSWANESNQASVVKLFKNVNVFHDVNERFKAKSLQYSFAFCFRYFYLNWKCAKFI